MEEKMIKSKSRLSIGLFLVIAMSGSTVLAGGKKIPIDGTFAGAFSNTVAHDPDGDGITPPIAFSALVHTIGHVRKLGRTIGRGFGAVPDLDTPPVYCTLESNDAPGTRFFVKDNPLVIIFVRDHSLLFGSGPGSVCVDFVSGRSEFNFELIINGGRGRFEGATGNLMIEGEAEPVGFTPVDTPDGPVIVPINLLAETGTTKGVAILP
jgi:hypothetical protein